MLDGVEVERNYRLEDSALQDWAERLHQQHKIGGDFTPLKQALNDLHPADIADLFELLEQNVALALVHQLGPRLQPALWPELEPATREELMVAMSPQGMAQALSRLETDDAVDVLEDLDRDQQNEILSSMPTAERWAVKDALRYPEYSAGRLMAREVVALPKDWTVGHAIDFMRISEDLPDNFYEVFLIDAVHRPVGQLALSKILRTKRRVKLEDLVQTLEPDKRHDGCNGGKAQPIQNPD